MYATVTKWIVLHCIALFILYCIALYCIVLCCIVLYCIVLYCMVLYCMQCMHACTAVFSAFIFMLLPKAFGIAEDEARGSMYCINLRAPVPEPKVV